MFLKQNAKCSKVIVSALIASFLLLFAPVSLFAVDNEAGIASEVDHALDFRPSKGTIISDENLYKFCFVGTLSRRTSSK